MTSSFLTTLRQSLGLQPLHAKLAMLVTATLCAALFTSVALINVAVLLLLLLAPFAWLQYRRAGESLEPGAAVFLAAVVLFCVWDVFTNVFAGHSLQASLQMLSRDLRPLAFVPILWALFANPRLARFALWALLVSALLLAALNLVLTLTGQVQQGQYFTKGLTHLSHLYGQALVGLVFVLAQVFLLKRRWRWWVGASMAVLILSLLLASGRRTGWLLLAAGFGVWALLNAKRLFVGKYKWWVVLAFLMALVAALFSDIVSARMALAWKEYKHFASLTPQERAVTAFGSVSLRLQYMVTVLEAIQQSNWWVGVGSIDLAKAYQAAATSLGVGPAAWETFNWRNPHNEYLFMWATKGLVGLGLYLAIFMLACRAAWCKQDEVQRVGLLVFVFLFMLSITANSMVIDMPEGHFTMLVLLIFLAPKRLGFLDPNGHSDVQAVRVQGLIGMPAMAKGKSA